MELTDYLQNACSQYHLIEALKQRLGGAGFTELSLENPFTLEPGNGYFVDVRGTALFAFFLPEDLTVEAAENRGMRMAAAHTDFPTFKIKPLPDLSKSSFCPCLGINAEPYGGMLKRTWFDRPLGLAGAVYVRGEDGETADGPVRLLYRSSRPLFLIPSLAPHMDRAIESKEIDIQKEIIPLMPIGGESAPANFISFLAAELQRRPEDILSFDLNFFLDEPPRIIGGGDQNCGAWLTAQGIDNAASVAILCESLIRCLSGGNSIALTAMFDNEEIGSRTKQGADSNLLTWVLERIFASQLLSSADSKKILCRSTFLSVDGAHAIHPNFPEKTDPSTVVHLGDGFVIKSSATQRYATDARVTAEILQTCGSLGIPVQRQANRSGSPGGQTLGPIVSGYLPVPTADIGIPMLGMHSIRETAALSDCDSLQKFTDAFLSGQSGRASAAPSRSRKAPVKSAPKTAGSAAKKTTAAPTVRERKKGSRRLSGKQ